MKGLNFLKSNYVKTLITLVIVILVFSFFPSCQKRDFMTSKDAAEGHPIRAGNVTAIPTMKHKLTTSQTKINDISIELKNSPEQEINITVMLNYNDDSNIEEITIEGTLTNEGTAKLLPKEQPNKVVGSAMCFAEACKHIVVDLYYLDEQNSLQWHQVESFPDAEQKIITYIEDSSEDMRSGDKPAEYITVKYTSWALEQLRQNSTEQINIVEQFSNVAPEGFSEFWNQYRANLNLNEQTNKIPMDTVQVLTSTEGPFFKIKTDAIQSNLAHPLNLRFGGKVTLGSTNQPVPFFGMLIGGVPLVNNAEECIKWADDISPNQQYSSHLLNAVLIFAGNKFKQNNGCNKNIFVARSSNQHGGKLILQQENERNTHQNGLDVEVSFIIHDDKGVQAPPFQPVIGASNEVLLRQNDKLETMKMLSNFVSSGMVNKFTMDPIIKASLTEYVKQNHPTEPNFKRALDKTYPAPGHDRHINLEITCAAKGVETNIGCRETIAKNMIWSTDWCDGTCCRSKETPDNKDFCHSITPNSSINTEPELKTAIAATLDAMVECDNDQKTNITSSKPQYEGDAFCLAEGLFPTKNMINGADLNRVMLCKWTYDSGQNPYKRSLCKVPVDSEGKASNIGIILDIMNECTDEQKTTITSSQYPGGGPFCLAEDLYNTNTFLTNEERKNISLCKWTYNATNRNKNLRSICKIPLK